MLTIREFLIDGKAWNKAASDYPVFSWTTEGDDLATAYHIQLSSGPAFDQLFWDTGKIESTRTSLKYGHGGFALRAVALRHGVFYVKIKLYQNTDVTIYECSFAVNQAPSAPVLTSPSGERLVGILPVKWAASVDADGDDINYYVEICKDATLGAEWKRVALPVMHDQLSCEIDLSGLQASMDYGVRVVATDGFCDSEPSNVGKFSYKPLPQVPKIVKPKAGERFNRVAEVEWESADPDCFFLVEHCSEEEWQKVAMYPPGTRKGAYSDIRPGDNCRVRITAISPDEYKSLPAVSDIFSVDLESSITAIESANNKVVLGTSDGRILSTKEEIWDEEIISSPETINTINPLDI